MIILGGGFDYLGAAEVLGNGCQGQSRLIVVAIRYQEGQPPDYSILVS